MNKKIIAIIAVIVIVVGGGVIALTQHNKKSAGVYSAKTMTPQSMMKHDGITLYVVSNNAEKLDADAKIRGILVTKNGITTTYDASDANVASVYDKYLRLNDIQKMSDQKLIKKYKAFNNLRFNDAKKHAVSNGYATESQLVKANVNHIKGKAKVDDGESITTVSNNINDSGVNQSLSFDAVNAIQPTKVGDSYYAGYGASSTTQLVTRTNENTKVTLK